MVEGLKNIKCFLLDMDGTVYLSGVPIDGAVDAVERMKKQGRVIFLTNNTSVSRNDYVEKIKKMGIFVTENDIYTAGNATIDYINKHHYNKKIFLLGTDKLRAEFSGSGINITDKNPDIVVIGFDTDLTYANLSKACAFIRGGVPYLLTHHDINCPVKNGYIPDVGSINALIEKSTDKKPFIVCGKPNSPIGDGIKLMTGYKNDEIAMIGDRLSTDMLFAVHNNFLPVLVLSGEARQADLENSNLKNKVNIVLNSIADWDKV